jgi:hypothetical protein
VTPAALLAHLRGLGVHLALVEGQLLCRFPAGALTPDLLAAIRAHHADLIAALRLEADPQPSGAPGDAAPPASPPAASHCADCGAGLAGSFERCHDCATRAVEDWKRRRLGGPQ